MGCRFPVEAAVYSDQHARLNSDASVAELNTPCGIYEPKCGTEKWLCSYGHDEYLFQVLEGNRASHTFPQQLWNIIRFHSLYDRPLPSSPPSNAHASPNSLLHCSYPWHTGTGSGGAYTHLMKPEDHALKTRVLKFNECTSPHPPGINARFVYLVALPQDSSNLLQV